MIFSLAFSQSAFSKAFRGAGKSLAQYWRIYGGIEAVLTSPFLIASAILALVVFPLWVSKDGWTPSAVTILPCLLGFSVSALAIVLAFPTNPIFVYMAEDGKDGSYYMGVVARLAHFIYVQVVAIVLAFLTMAYSVWPVRLLGLTFLFYAVLSAAATAMSFFGAAQLYNAAAATPADPEPPDPDSQT